MTMQDAWERRRADFAELPKAEFDALCKSKAFVEGPLREELTDWYKEFGPYSPGRWAFGLLHNGRKVCAKVCFKEGTLPMENKVEIDCDAERNQMTPCTGNRTVAEALVDARVELNTGNMSEEMFSCYDSARVLAAEVGRLNRMLDKAIGMIEAIESQRLFVRGWDIEGRGYGYFGLNASGQRVFMGKTLRGAMEKQAEM